MLPQDMQFPYVDYFDGAGRVRPGRVLRVEGHAHTDHADGYGPARACCERAAELGLHTLVFAEHMRRGAPWRDAYFDEVEQLKKEFAGRVRIVCGIEARALDTAGRLDTDAASLDRAELVVGAVHGLWGTGQGGADPFFTPGPDRALEDEDALLHGLARNARVHVIGHPYAAYFEKFGNPPAARLRALARSAARQGKALEINARHGDVPWMTQVLAGAAPGLLIWPASDAHLARHVGRAAHILVPSAFNALR